jgi:hypothetical protein
MLRTKAGMVRRQSGKRSTDFVPFTEAKTLMKRWIAPPPMRLDKWSNIVIKGQHTDHGVFAYEKWACSSHKGLTYNSHDHSVHHPERAWYPEPFIKVKICPRHPKLIVFFVRPSCFFVRFCSGPDTRHGARQEHVCWSPLLPRHVCCRCFDSIAQVIHPPLDGPFHGELGQRRRRSRVRWPPHPFPAPWFF